MELDQETVMNLGDAAADNLYPALFQCFTIILCGWVVMHCSKFTVVFIKIIYHPLIRTYGNRSFNFRYIAGRLNVVSSTESKGIATFVGTFALPSLIFVSLARLDFTTVNWTFLLAILLAKGVIFLGVIVVTVSVSKPIHFGRAGIFAIFCTQSNDFALGYPISEFITFVFKSTSYLNWTLIFMIFFSQCYLWKNTSGICSLLIFDGSDITSNTEPNSFCFDGS